MPDTLIAWLNELDQGQPNYIDFLYRKKRPVGELKITGVDSGETEASHIEIIEPETDLDTISDGTETIP